MRKLMYIIINSYTKFKNPKIQYIFEKTLVLFIICNKCKNEVETKFKEEESMEI